MFRMVFGALFLLIGLVFVLERGRLVSPLRTAAFRTAGLMMMVLGAALGISAGATIIDVGETGVVHAFGRVSNTPVTSGFHIIPPWSSVEKFRVREIQFPAAGQVEAMDALSREQMAVEVEVAVRYQIRSEDVVELYKRIGDHDAVENAVLNAIRAGVRDGMARHAIGEIQFRDSISANMASAVQEKLISRDPTPLHIATVTQLFLRKVTPPGSVAQSINAKIQQEQQIQTEAFRVQVEQQKAKQRVTEAQGIADAQRIINQTLTPQLLMREYMTSLVKVSESNAATIVLPTEGGLPLLDMTSFNRRVRGTTGQ